MLGRARAATSRCSERPPPPTIAWSADVVEQLAAGEASRCARTAVRWRAPACGWRCGSAATRRSGWRGWSSTCRRLAGSGIVYTLTKRDAEQVAAFLNANGISALAYSGEQETEDRVATEERLLANEVKAVVATSALGMGYDKSDLTFVVHYQAPGSVVSYYQQVGRAGRGVEHADVVLLRGGEDRRIQDFFIEQAFPSRERVERRAGRARGRRRGGAHDAGADGGGQPRHGAASRRC